VFHNLVILRQVKITIRENGIRLNQKGIIGILLIHPREILIERVIKVEMIKWMLMEKMDRKYFVIFIY
jgi:hypothetical protein